MNRNDSSFKENQKRYQQTFGHLQIPQLMDIKSVEQNQERKTPMKKMKTLAISAATAVVCLIGATSAYAADLGGIRTTINSWFNGQQAQIEAVDNGDGGYTFFDEQGTPIGAGGGVTFDENGNEIQLPADDVYENGFAESIEEENGRTYLISFDRKVDISDLMNKSGTTRVKLMVNGVKRYFAIEQLDAQNHSWSSTETPEEGFTDKDYQDLDA